VLNQFEEWSTASAGAPARQTGHQIPSPWN
jgi:hypothetical protein